MRKFLIVLWIVVVISVNVRAQDYTTGIGLRAGTFSGLTVKHFINSTSALEGMLAMRWKGVMLTGLYERHHPVIHGTTFRWYYGAGAHLGFWDGERVSWGSDGRNYALIGADLVAGLEYTFRGAPVGVGIDWRPMFNIIGDQSVWFDAGSVFVRYVF